MENQDIVLTKEILEQGESINGAFNFDQCRVLGVEIPLKSGWRQRLIGKVVSSEAIEQFLALKNAHISAKRLADKQKSDSTSLQNLGYVWKQHGNVDYGQIMHNSPVFKDICGNNWVLCNQFLGEDGSYQYKPAPGLKFGEHQAQD